MRKGFNVFKTYALSLGLLDFAAAQAALPSLEDFAARPRIESASISPDGHYIALINTQDGRGAAVVVDRSPSHTAPNVVLTEPPHFRLTWCRWATDTRLLCGFLGMVKPNGYVYAVTRLVAVDADGKNTKVLIQNSETAQGQFQDRVVNWNPGPANSVLIEADEGLTDAQATGLSSERCVSGTRHLDTGANALDDLPGARRNSHPGVFVHAGGRALDELTSDYHAARRTHCP